MPLPAQVHATLLDEGTYLCSPRTMYWVQEPNGDDQQEETGRMPAPM